MAFSPSSDGIIYVTGADRQVVALDAITGDVKAKFEASKHPLSCLAIGPGRLILSDAYCMTCAMHGLTLDKLCIHADNLAFGGGSSLALWDLSSEERKAKYTGHPVRIVMI